MKQNYRSDLSKAKNLGPSGGAVYHWWHQRLSAIILVLLFTWFFYFAYSVANSDLNAIIELFKKPYNIIAVIIFVFTGLYHGMLGLESVIQDYISCRILRLISILSIQIFFLITAISFVIAIFYIIIL